MNKDSERNKNSTTAGRLKYLLSDRFETQGFGPNDKVTIRQAMEMVGYNK